MSIILLLMLPIIALYAGIPVMLGVFVIGGIIKLLISSKNSSKMLGRIIIILLFLSVIAYNFVVVYGHKFLPFLR